MKRRISHEVKIGDVVIGGNKPIAIQAMTNTDTANVDSTLKQINELTEAGAELVRVTVNNEEAADAIHEIKKKMKVPLIGDFHYNGHILLDKYPRCAKALDKYRINPGNVGLGKFHDKNFKKIIEIALQYNKPVRIGVNWGSLDQAILTKLMDENSKKDNPEESRVILRKAIVESALQSAKLAEEYGMKADKIVLSTKVSNVTEMVKTYQELASKCDYALHLGLTEAGMGSKGIVATSAALALLLYNGIGDTIRASLTPKIGESRNKEVIVCQQILQELGIRNFSPSVTSCPGCGRTASNKFQSMTEEMNLFIKERMPVWKDFGYEGVKEMQVAVMGCIVNGPGESKHANIGISLPGTGENPRCPVYADGKQIKILDGDSLMDDFKNIVEDYVKERYGKD